VTDVSEIELVKGWYDALARGDTEEILSPLAENIEWREAEGHPYQPAGSVWRGGEAVVADLFVRLAGEWDGFAVMPAAFHDAGEIVVVEGRYTGSFKSTGKRLDAQFCHIWRVRAGKLVQFQQYTDTGQFQLATTGAPAYFSNPWLEMLAQL
jgi:ketosteroid isomerase-like protein